MIALLHEPEGSFSTEKWQNSEKLSYDSFLKVKSPAHLPTIT